MITLMLRVGVACDDIGEARKKVRAMAAESPDIVDLAVSEAQFPVLAVWSNRVSRPHYTEPDYAHDLPADVALRTALCVGFHNFTDRFHLQDRATGCEITKWEQLRSHEVEVGVTGR